MPEVLAQLSDQLSALWTDPANMPPLFAAVGVWLVAKWLLASRSRP